MVGLGLAYYSGAQIGFALTLGSIPTSIFWLPNSLVFAALLLLPPRRWPLYVAAVLPAHVAVQVQNEVPSLAMLLLFVTNVADGALGAAIVRRYSRGEPRFDSFRNVGIFVVGAITAPLLISFLDAGVAVATGWAGDYWRVWHTRFRSNALTNLIWVPALVIACTRGLEWAKTCSRRCYVEASLLVLALLVVGNFVFGAGRAEASNITGLLLSPLPLFLWASARFGIGGVSAALLGFALLVIVNAVRGRGPFATYSPDANVLALQVFLTLLAMPLLLLAALLEDQRRAEDALREREAQYRSIFESAGNGVLITDLEHGVVAANPAFFQLTGYGPEQLQGFHPRSFFHVDDLKPLDDYLARAAAGEVVAVSVMCVRRDGGLSQFELQGRRFNYAGQPHVQSVIRDVTERERAFQLLEQRVVERTRALSTLLQISKTVASTLELKPLLDIVLEQLQAIVRYSGATIAIEDDAELVIAGHRGPSSQEVIRLRVPMVELADWPVLERNSPLIVEDLQGDGTSSQAFRSTAPKQLGPLFHHARSCLIVPLKARDRSIGLLLIQHEEPGKYALHDAELAWALASQAAVAIENAQLYDQARELAAFEERQRLARDLHDSVTQTLHAIVMASERVTSLWERDPAEGRRALTHVRGMAQIAFAELRTLLVELRPIELVEGDLGDLLSQLAEAVRSRLSIPIKVVLNGSVRLPPDVQVAHYRIAQEALSNVTKHAAAARSVELTLTCSENEVKLRIRDDGPGFAHTDPVAGHLGLGIMRERAQSIGADLRLVSTPGRGTTVSLHWTPPQSTRDGDPTAVRQSAVHEPARD